MSHIGILYPLMTGHINFILSLTQELQKRSRTTTFFQFFDGRKTIEGAGLNFQVIAEKECPIVSQNLMTSLVA
jgi:UDP:flavonoid glycosyltransferase YjiC (YdhE family)